MESRGIESSSSSPHVDVSRRAAFREWTARLKDVETAISALKAVSQDPRLYNVAKTPDPGLMEDSMSFDEFSIAFGESTPQLRSLRKDLKGMQTKVAKVRNTSLQLVPIHRLPPELLRSIFLLLATDTPRKFSPYMTWNTRHTLSSVCSRWNDIIQNTSILWAYLDFMDGPKFKYTKTSLVRAKDMLLDARFELSTPRVRKNFEAAIALGTPTVLSKIGRLCLAGTRKSIADAIKTIEKSYHGLDATHSVTIEPQSPSSDNRSVLNAAVQSFLQGMSGLTEVRLVATDLDFSQAPLTGLRSVRLAGIRIPPPALHFVSFLQSNPTLTELIIENMYTTDVDAIVEVDPILMADLDLLVLVKVTPYILRQFFSTVRAPSLRSICLDSFQEATSAGFNDFIRRSSCSKSIRSVELHHWEEPNTPGWPLLFLDFSLMESLALNRATLPPAFLSFLTPVILAGVSSPTGSGTGRIPTACPNLKELKLHFTRGVSHTLLLSLIEARANFGEGVSPIETLSVKGCKLAVGVDKAVIDETGAKLKELVKELTWEWRPNPDFQWINMPELANMMQIVDANMIVVEDITVGEKIAPRYQCTCLRPVDRSCVIGFLRYCHI
jgi:hypothetical protein